MSDDKLYDFTATLLHESIYGGGKAILLDCGGSKNIWFPKYLTQDNGDGTFTVPEWLAVSKGIV